LGLQQNFDWLVGISKDTMKDKENNCEINFEMQDFDGFAKKLKAREDIVLLHDVLEQPWGQRGISFYDLDNHLIEVGESLKAVVERFRTKGMSIEHIAEKMDVTEVDVNRMLEE